MSRTEAVDVGDGVEAIRPGKPGRRRVLTVLSVLLTLAALALVVPTSAITLARTTESPAMVWVLLRSLTPYAVISYGVAATTLVLAAALGQGRWRGVVSVLLVGVLVALVAHVYWAAGPFVGSRPKVGGQSLAVMSANLHLGEADVDAVLSDALRRDVDLLALLEVSPNQVAALQESPAAAPYRYSVGGAAYGRDGVVLLSRYPLSDERVLSMSSPGWAATVTVADTALRVLVVHPISPNNGIDQWYADHDTVRSVAESEPLPTVILGDFNATMDHKPMLQLRDEGFADAVTQANAGWAPTWPADGRRSVFGVTLPALATLDHVMVRGVAARSAATLTVPGSDHRALFARLTW